MDADWTIGIVVILSAFVIIIRNNRKYHNGDDDSRDNHNRNQRQDTNQDVDYITRKYSLSDAKNDNVRSKDDQLVTDGLYIPIITPGNLVVASLYPRQALDAKVSVTSVGGPSKVVGQAIISRAYNSSTVAIRFTLQLIASPTETSPFTLVISLPALNKDSPTVPTPAILGSVVGSFTGQIVPALHTKTLPTSTVSTSHLIGTVLNISPVVAVTRDTTTAVVLYSNNGVTLQQVPGMVTLLNISFSYSIVSPEEM